jgi:hypothetical protein
LPHGSSSDVEQKSSHSFIQEHPQAEISQPDTPPTAPAPLLDQEYAIPRTNSSDGCLFSTQSPERRLSTRNYIAYLYRSGYSTDQVRHILMQNYQQNESEMSSTSPVADPLKISQPENNPSKLQDGEDEIDGNQMYPQPLNISKTTRSFSSTGP